MGRRDAMWTETVMARADQVAESDYRKQHVDGFQVESVRRGTGYGDWMAWVDNNRKCWGAGSTRQDAVKSAVLTAKSHSGSSEVH